MSIVPRVAITRASENLVPGIPTGKGQRSAHLWWHFPSIAPELLDVSRSGYSPSPKDLIVISRGPNGERASIRAFGHTPPNPKSHFPSSKCQELLPTTPFHCQSTFLPEIPNSDQTEGRGPDNSDYIGTKHSNTTQGIIPTTLHRGMHQKCP
jgi:hypothetical protein